MASPENQHCANCIGTVAFHIAERGCCAKYHDHRVCMAVCLSVYTVRCTKKRGSKLTAIILSNLN